MQGIRKLFEYLADLAGSIHIQFGKPLHTAAPNTLVFFPDQPNVSVLRHISPCGL